jgi:site-specific recombinase XerD
LAGGLTVFAIKAAKVKARATGKRVAKKDGRALFYVALPSGGESWVQYFRVHQTKGLAKVTLKEPGIGIAGARKWAAEIRDKAARGIDPREEKKDARSKAKHAAASTLRTVAEQYLKRETKRLRTINQRQATLERLILPRLGDRPIAEIKRSEIVRLLDQVEDDRGARMADEVLAVVRKVMGWHATREDEFRSPIVRGMSRTNKKERARTRILSDDELRSVWAAADAMPGTFGALVQFILLTATRRNEAACLRRSELDGIDWTIPAARYKGKHDHLVPLSAAALAVIEKVPVINDSDWVFTTTGNHPATDFATKKRQFDKLCGVTGWRLHDLRRTSRSLLSRAGVSADHAERCLGHIIGGVRGVYDRHEFRAEKKRAFEVLAAEIERIVEPPQGNVVPMRGSSPI